MEMTDNITTLGRENMALREKGCEDMNCMNSKLMDFSMLMINLIFFIAPTF
jgi:hypothetical protein